MVKFINKQTGNTLCVKDEGTIAMMRNSDRYEEVKATKTKITKTKADAEETDIE